MKKIFVISKNKTTNLGNIALTAELTSLFTRKFSDQSLIFAGRPVGINLVSYQALNESVDYVKLFEKWKQAVLRRISDLTPVWNEKMSTLNVSYVEPSVTNTNKSFLSFKKFIKKLIVKEVTEKYRERMSAMLGADLVVYSGAGEVCDDVTFLRQLLELAVLQAKGIRTCAINQSINLRNERMIKLCNSVYSRMDAIAVRGHHSKAKLVAMGVPEEKIFVCPDTAVLTKPNELTSPGNAVGINFTPYTRFSTEGMREVINYLRSMKYEVSFVTNNPHDDQRLIEFFIREFDVHPTEQLKEHKGFSASLSKFRYIISSRLHTNVLSLCAGVPVVPIEGQFYKTIEMFDLFQYPIPVIDKNAKGWEFEIVDRIKILEKDYDATKELVVNNLDRWRRMAEGNYEVVRDSLAIQ